MSFIVAKQPNIAVFKRTRNTFDVFQGELFEQHSYFRLNNGRQLELLKGSSLDSADYSIVREYIRDQMV